MAAHRRSDVVRYTKRLNSEFAEVGDIRGARALIDEMLMEQATPSLVTANTLIKAYRVARQPQGAEAVLNDIRRWGLSPDGCTYSTILDAYGLAGQIAEAFRILALAEAVDAADSRVYSTLVRYVSADDIEPLLSRMAGRGITPNLTTCNAILGAFAAAGRPQRAVTFFGKYMGGPLRPDRRSHALLLKAHCSAGDAAAAERLLLELFESAEGHADGPSRALCPRVGTPTPPPHHPTTPCPLCPRVRRNECSRNRTTPHHHHHSPPLPAPSLSISPSLPLHPSLPLPSPLRRPPRLPAPLTRPPISSRPPAVLTPTPRDPPPRLAVAAVSTVMNLYVSQRPPDLRSAQRLMTNAEANGVQVSEPRPDPQPMPHRRVACTWQRLPVACGAARARTRATHLRTASHAPRADLRASPPAA